MARDDLSAVQADPHIPPVSLLGEVTDESVRTLIEQLRDAEKQGEDPVTVEISTLGGDAEAARRMVLEIDLARQRLAPRRLLFLGKTTVYSAGVTLMAGFPREDRFLTRDTMLLIHCRQLDETLEISGPLRGSRAKVQALLHQIDIGVKLEVENFQRLIEGSDVTMDELLEKALYNWYVPAEVALERGLVAGLI
ncbi:peptidase S14 [Croceibacterium aestuarii]|uniref:peptidase S14 n=1 Tax=Croceibacterium aestuarii TaxID=3064139 RepID=UPI00272DEF10|nr:peptidase S14 [Croceibacterium sp. D39]